MMFAIHDALRRDLDRISNMETRSDGWDFFERMLHAHHNAEDELLWPVVREAVAGRPDDVALVDRMETEHAAVAPALDAVDRAFSQVETMSDARATLDARVREHLTHEEEAALPMIDRSLSEDQWMAFGQGSTRFIGDDMPRFFPWVVVGADEPVAAHLLSMTPPPVRETYENTWRRDFLARDRWATPSSVG
jgi:hemerythrin-like domain-containing protein